ncbi:MAG TPA: PIN domain-containing protein [Thermohalobaculum sp.]|nr:PIN domain-containing protein [Thermohalobaculum sp.]
MTRVFLDACVLYPPLVRGVILGAAEAGLFQPFWSPRVLDEWRLAMARNGGDVARVEAVIERMGESFPDACVAPDPEVEAGIGLPDPADAHVLAGAVAARAEILLTFNLRDFPARRLAAHGVAARHPDGFLWELLSHAPEAMDAAIRRACAAAGAEAPGDIRRALKRAKLPRLGKAWEAAKGGSDGRDGG